MYYFHLSRDPNLKVLTPRIPESAVGTFENITTPRVCLSDTIEGCMSALEDPYEYYVYITDKDIDVYKPNVNEVRDSKYTGEVWYLSELPIYLFGKIKSYDHDKITRYDTSRGTVSIKHYPYEWVT